MKRTKLVTIQLTCEQPQADTLIEDLLNMQSDDGTRDAQYPIVDIFIKDYDDESRGKFLKLADGIHPSPDVQG